MANEESCYVCGDGVEPINGNWRHCEDLGIDMNGQIVTTACNWGKPYEPRRFDV